jgi:hypothetical protein
MELEVGHLPQSSAEFKNVSTLTLNIDISLLDA